ncbi:MAG: [protein-PII] uridylyltransferase [Methylophaga sp.]|uniref:[protein-PII] uridylyltransferase n=1 Tax=Methylophaga sp. UBA678 TaxID=1946901 RepID=UPI000C39778F|nr:[protein-PII] uridylyltransferase [Methylophaga sp. UBA678]MAX53164.1 [protein-PII] uridylyltransferase [Methylophaga sp.]|tara:strand:- start:34193 stop:36811 length:2619 start_codon:yes stop_codon:yes gene_type:complete
MPQQTLSIWEVGNLVIPSDAEVTNEICRQALKQGQLYLQQQFDAGSPIEDLVYQRASFVDEILTQIWQQHISDDTPVSLIAVGGYGRGELHPYSDIDVLILLDESISDTPPDSLSSFLTQLWDVGLEIGHSVRTIQECRQQAEDDITIATNLLEARLLCGHSALFESLQQLTVTNKTWDTRHFFELKRQEQLDRHQRYNDTANNLEPNIKESPGGLRDIQVVNWVAQQHFDVKNLEGLRQKGFLANSEYETLQKAQNFLWTIRFVLHHLAGRKQEKLMIDFQRELAKKLGYKDDDSRLAVEKFMKDYYRCARSVRQMNSLLLQLFEETIILADEPREVRVINRRFQSHNGYLETINPGIFAYYPYALLEVFLILQQNPELKGVRASTIRQIHAHLHLIDDNFRRDIKNRTLFMEIIRQPKGVTHEFRRMNELGVLGAYLPEFGRVVGQMQHDLFHAYTVDEHTLFLVGNLRRFSCEENREEFPLCSEVFNQLPKPEILYIAGIYHDIAKGRGGDHSVLGVVDAKAFCERHNLSEYDTNIVAFLIRYHLAMSTTAQKSDLEDPTVIKKFADLVETTERLNYLYLLTVADIRATNNNLWNGWRDSLLKQLYHSTHQWIEHTEAQAKSTREKSYKKYQEAMQQLLSNGRSQEDISQLWHAYDLDYFLRHSIDELVWQSEQRLDHMDDDPLIALRKHNDQLTLEIFIVTHDRAGIFAAITAALEQCQLNVLDAKINVTNEHDALNTFIVNGDRLDTRQITRSLEKQLANTSHVKPYSPTITPRTMKLFKTQPNIEFETNLQQNHTVMSLHTHDRPGLVSAIAQVFLACKVQLINAKINTLGDQVEDVFFITTADENALDELEENNLKEQLLTNLSH